MMPPSATASLHRRLRFAESWRYRIDATLLALGLRRSYWLSTFPHAAGKLAFDLLDFVRTGGHVSRLGRPHLAALATSVRLAQDPRYRGYWYDPDMHSLVGLHLGIDLHRYRGKYYVIESNINPAMRPERRQLYDATVDPLISELVRVARAGGFDRIVLCRRTGTASDLREFEQISRETNVEVVAASIASMNQKGNAPVNGMLALPQRLQPKTLYMIWTPLRVSTLFHFIHSKDFVSNFLANTTIADGDPAGRRLSCIPSFDRPVVVDELNDGRWPNLVVKLSDADNAKFVAMGRFANESHARRELRIDDRPGRIPEVFHRPLHQKLLDAVLPGKMRPIYQPFIPPEVVDGRARLIRLHAFVSPLVNTFLSAHGVVAGGNLPKTVPAGLVESDAYIVNYSRGGRYCRLEGAIEDELRDVAEEFGRLALRAISARFEVSPGDCIPDGRADRHARDTPS